MSKWKGGPHAPALPSLQWTPRQEDKMLPRKNLPQVGSQWHQGITDVQVQAAAHLQEQHNTVCTSALGFFCFFLHLFRAPETYDIIWIFMARCVKAEAVHLITGVHPCAGVTWIPHFWPRPSRGADSRALRIFQQPFQSQSPCNRVQLATLLHLRGKLALGTNKASNWFNLKFQTSVCCSASDCHLLFQLAVTESTFLLCLFKQVQQCNINFQSLGVLYAFKKLLVWNLITNYQQQHHSLLSQLSTLHLLSLKPSFLWHATLGMPGLFLFPFLSLKTLWVFFQR